MIEHAEGDIPELFGREKILDQDLASYLKQSGHDVFQLPAWLENSQDERQAIRTQLEGRTGDFTPIELQATYQGNGVHLVSIRSVFTEIVEQFAAQQVGILEMLARGKAKDDVLTRLVLLIEEVMPGATGSILFLDHVKKCLRQGVGPNLPQEYNQKLDGLPIGPNVGSCGTALYQGTRIVVKDIHNDPLWIDYLGIIKPLGYQACWSTPFFAESGQALGTFAIYYREKRGPQSYELAILDAASHLAAVVVSHHLNQERLQAALTALKQSEDRLQSTFDYVNDAIFIHDSGSGAIIDVNQRTVEMYGWTKEEIKRLKVGELSAGLPPYTQEEAVQWIQRAEAEGPQIFEWRAKHRNGNLFWVEVNLRFAQLGEHNRVLVTVRDIGERKHIEERLELALRGADLGLWDWNILTGEVALGERWLTMLGYQTTDLPHTVQTWRQLLHPDDGLLAEKALQDHFAKKVPQYDIEFRMRTKSGGWHWVQARGRVMEWYPEGMPLRMTGTHLDIHARKIAEEELQKSQRRYELVLAGSGAGLWDWNMDTGACYFSPRVAELLGLAESELPKTLDGLIELTHPQDEPLLRQALHAHIHQHAPYEIEYRLRTKSGTYRWFSATGQAAYDEQGRPRQMAGSLIDVHERRCAEEHIRENKRVLETLLGNLAGMAYRCRIDDFWTMEFVSHGCLTLTGYQPEDLLNNNKISYEEVTHPEDRQRVRNEIQKALNQGRQFELSYRIVTADGDERIVWERGIGIHAENGRLEYLEGFITDITEIRHSQNKIAEQAALLDRAQDAIIVRDLHGTITYWNQGASRLYGWGQEEALGKPVLKLFYSDNSGYLKALQAVLEHSEWSGELQHITRENREITIESRWTLLRDEKGSPKSILTIDTDVTEKKRLEAQFLRAQRMESIGTLAGGIAHDLNNVLAPIIMSIDLLRLSVKSEEDQELLNQMYSSANRGADLVRQVLSFARGVGGRRVSINPSYLIKEVAKIATETFPRSITIRSHRSAELWMVSGDPTQLHQVLLNLCVNARDAMPQGGTLSLLAENAEIDTATAATMDNAHAGQFVRFIVEDTGSGIPDEVLGKIFEPFFTTKEIGKGTGLGLSTVLAIVRSHGGFIQVESVPDKGSTFQIYLPTSNQQSVQNESRSSVQLPQGHGEHILVVDDEAAVRSALKSTLTAYGYNTLLAENGAEALAIYEKERGLIKAIITDMMMPVMDGPTMITTLRQMQAKLPIIASSGLNESINVGRATAAGVNHFLAKPYSAETVLRALHEVLTPGNSS
jgi:PAS domain S-box-containing protein